jgi:5-methylcytosine-specific restriction endonuclease McrA
MNEDIINEEKKKDRKFSNNPNWRGSIKNLSRRGWHYRVEIMKGKAKEHKCKYCGNKNAPQESNQWAFTGALDGTPKKLSQFIPLCKSCHSKKDGKHKNFSKKTNESFVERVLKYLD